MTSADQNGRTTTERLSKARLASRDISELIGLCKGVLADGTVNIMEAEFLIHWLESHRIVVDHWPADILYRTLGNALEDGVLSNEEEGELVGLLAEITGAPVRVIFETRTKEPTDQAQVERTLNTPTTLPINEPESGISFEGANFVLTGNFTHGTRKQCEDMVRKIGGIPQKTVIKSTDYLVIGDIGSESWAHSSFGRKIEKAIVLRDAGQDIHIISEAYWADQLGKCAAGRFAEIFGDGSN